MVLGILKSYLYKVQWSKNLIIGHLAALEIIVSKILITWKLKGKKCTWRSIMYKYMELWHVNRSYLSLSYTNQVYLSSWKYIYILYIYLYTRVAQIKCTALNVSLYCYNKIWQSKAQLCEPYWSTYRRQTLSSLIYYSLLSHATVAVTNISYIYV